MAKDPDISDRVNRVEEILTPIDADECSLKEGEDLYEEGQQLLNEVRELLYEGEVIEIGFRGRCLSSREADPPEESADDILTSDLTGIGDRIREHLALPHFLLEKRIRAVEYRREDFAWGENLSFFERVMVAPNRVNVLNADLREYLLNEPLCTGVL